MKKILLATAAGAALLSSTFIAPAAHADEPPAFISTLAGQNPADFPEGVPAELSQDAPEFKVDFDWTIPTNENGTPFTSCNAQLIRADGSVANEAPFPAGLPTLTYRFHASETNDPTFTPGRSTLSLNYTCFNGAGDTSELQHVDSVVVPDVVPTSPAYVNIVDPSAAIPVVSFGGSETLGVAQLEGYKVDVLDDYTVVASDFTPVTNSAVRGAKRTPFKAASAAPTSLSSTLANLPAGLYQVKVQGVNAVGLSAPASTTVRVLGSAPAAEKSSTSNAIPTAEAPLPVATTPPTVTTSDAAPAKVAATPVTPTKRVSAPGKVRMVTPKVTKSSAILTWKAPANNAAMKYSVRISNQGKVKTYALATKMTLKLTGLKKNTTYSFWVIATGSQSDLTSLTPSSFKTKKH